MALPVNKDGIQAFFSEVYHAKPKEQLEEHNRVYSRADGKPGVKVIIDIYNGCHIHFPANIEIPLFNLKGGIISLNNFIKETRQFDSLWLDFEVPVGASYLSLLPQKWELGKPGQGNIIYDTQKNVVRCWQWHNPEKVCTIPAGATHHLDASAAVIDSVAQKILLVVDRMSKDRWSLPGGGFEPDKDKHESSCSTAVRECEEEAGIKIPDKNGILIGQFTYPKNQFAVAINQVWRFSYDNGSKVEPKIYPKEVIDAAWVSFKDVEAGVYKGLKIDDAAQGAIRSSNGFSKQPSSEDWMKLWFENSVVKNSSGRASAEEMTKKEAVETDSSVKCQISFPPTAAPQVAEDLQSKYRTYKIVAAAVAAFSVLAGVFIYKRRS